MHKFKKGESVYIKTFKELSVGRPPREPMPQIMLNEYAGGFNNIAECNADGSYYLEELGEKFHEDWLLHRFIPGDLVTVKSKEELLQDDILKCHRGDYDTLGVYYTQDTSNLVGKIHKISAAHHGVYLINRVAVVGQWLEPAVPFCRAGDKVRIKSRKWLNTLRKDIDGDFLPLGKYYFVKGMIPYCGRTIEVKEDRYDNDDIIVTTDGYNFSREMIEKVIPKTD